MKLMYYLFCFAWIAISCTGRAAQRGEPADSIYVTFDTYNSDRSISTRCIEYAKIAQRIHIDTVIPIDSVWFEKIRHYVSSPTIDSTMLEYCGCDTRMVIQWGKSALGMSFYTPCISNQEDIVVKPDWEILHYIKWKSGFYNYFSRYSLWGDSTVVLYGIPEDYHCISQFENEFEDYSIPRPFPDQPKKWTEKVAFVKKK